MTYPEARFVRLPLNVPGMSSVDENGEPMIYLNDRLTLAQHLRTYAHELEHITRDDFFNDLPIEAIERKPPQLTSVARQGKPKKPTADTPRDYLARLLASMRSQASPKATECLDAIFAHKAHGLDQIKLRGWVLYGLEEDSPFWEQIILTHVLYGDNLPHRQCREARYATRRTIPYEMMKRVIYALTQAATPDQ